MLVVIMKNGEYQKSFKKFVNYRKSLWWKEAMEWATEKFPGAKLENGLLGVDCPQIIVRY